jgi:hypothetical protein
MAWEDGEFTKVEILAYSPEYEDIMGAFPGFRITRYTPEKSLKPGEFFSYTLKLTVEK